MKSFKHDYNISSNPPLTKQFIYDICRNAPDQTLLLLTRNHFEWARAFWGRDVVSISLAGEYEMFNPSWMFHIQKIVLEEDPIKYLEEFIDQE